MRREEIETVAKLSPLQEGLLFHSVKDGASTAYVNQHSVLLEGDLNWELFQKAWQEVVRRHQILRTSFHWEGLQQPVQIVHRNVPIEMALFDWRSLPKEQQERDWIEANRQDRERGFDAGKAPLFRVRVVRLEDTLYHLCWTHHHLILDGWSGAMAARDLFLIYDAFCHGVAPDLSNAGRFTDFVGWLSQQDPAAARSYWMEALKDFAAATPLPYAERSNEGDDCPCREERLLPAETSRSIRSRLARNGFTLSTLMNAAWALVLMRHSGQNDVTFGITTSGRPPELPSIETTGGLFINTLPLRIRRKSEDTVSAFLQHVQQQTLELRCFEHASLPEVQRWAGVAPLFESLLVVETYPIEGIARFGLKTLRIRNVAITEHTTYPLSIVVGNEERISVSFTYDARFFRRSHASRLMNEFLLTVEELASSKQLLLTSIPRLDAAEKVQAIEKSRGPETDDDLLVPLHEQFRKQAAAHPDAVAIACGSESISYRELDARSDAIAHKLSWEGVGPEVPVTIVARRSIDTVTAILGTLKAGGAYVPLDPVAPDSRNEAIRSSLGPHVAYESRPNDPCGTTPEPAIFPETLAYIIHTSGSTGRPRGVAVSHGNLFHSTRARFHFYAGRVSAFLLLSPLHFDSSVAGLFWTLASGGTLVLAHGDGPLDSGTILQAVEAHSVSHLLTLPSLYRELLRDARSHSLGSLRVAIVAGESCPAILAAEHACTALNTDLVNEYGPTEATVWCTAGRLRPGASSISIGRPIVNTSIYLMDMDGQLVPTGASGELHIGGPGIARGYWRRPDLTAIRFIPDPFSKQPGSRMYATGDLASSNADGEIAFLGRIDNQVKIRGFRVEPSEIEECLLRREGVEACAIVAERSHADVELAAFVTGRATESQLLEYARKMLPSYMRPRRIISVPELPRTSTGKCDYRKLTRMATARRQAPAEPIVSPLTPSEELIATVWREVLGLEAVGRNQNFFDLGGHSIHALRAVGRLRDKLAVDVRLQALFDNPILADFAASVDRLSDSEESRIPRLSDESGAFPLSFAQERMWLMHKATPDSAAYNIPIIVEIEGVLHVDALGEMLWRLVERHEPLRTVVVERGGCTFQHVLPSDPPAVPITDLSHLPEEKAEMEEARLIRQEAMAAFSLERMPPFRLHLIRRNEIRHSLLIVIHHIAADAWSMRILLREAAELYAGTAAGRTPQLSPLSLRYRDFASWQRQLLRPDAISYWKGQLDRVQHSLELPVDRSHSTGNIRAIGVVSMQLDDSLGERLAEFTRRKAVTPFMVFTAACTATLFCWTGQQEICIATPSDERTQPELEKLIGLFVNTLVLRFRKTPDCTLDGILDQTRQVVLDAQQHRDAPFDVVLDAVRSEGDRRPLFEFMLVYQDEWNHGPQQAGDVTFQVRTPPATTAKFPLTLTVGQGPNGSAVHWEFDSRRFEPTTIENLASAYVRTLRALLMTGHRRLSDVVLTDDTEERLLLECGRGPHIADAGCDSIVEAIRRQASEQPDSPALECDGQIWSYSRLVAEAERVAAALKRRDICPGDVVVIAALSAPRTIATLLGILKTGAAYLPLDPTDPIQRIAAVIRDARAKIVVAASDLRYELQRLSIDAAGIDELFAEQLKWESTHHGDAALTAYIVYTSGSTGRPKGVAVSHGAVLRLAYGLDNIVELSGRRMLHAAPLAFDASIFELWAALIRGSCVVMPPIAMQSIRDLANIVKTSRADTAWLTSSLFNALVETDLASLASVQQLLIGGEALSVSHVKRYRTRYRSSKLINGYGPTENTTFTCCYSIPGVVPNEWPSIPIGQPIGGTRVYLLDNQLKPVPIGMAGELWTSGLGLATGYANDPALTAERFLPDPFAGSAGARIYRTGDRARWRADGSIEFLGRTDRQVKIHGHRIELSEIEQILREHPEVRDAAVRVTASPDSNKILVGYCVLPLERTPDPGQILNWMRGRAPHYLVPNSIVALDVLPRNANGKLDYAALPVALTERPTPVAPRTELERKLQDSWASVFRTQSFGVEDDFFALGGDSLLALRVCAKAADLGLAISLRDVLEQRTIARLATSATVTAACEGMPVEIQPVPLNASQQFLLLGKSDPPDHYNISGFVEIQTRLTDEEWVRVAESLSLRHDSLRLRFRISGGIWRAEIQPTLRHNPFHRVCLNGLAPDVQDQRMAEFANRQQRELSLTEGRMFALVLFELGAGRNDHLLVVVHHMAADGASMPIFLSSLETALSGTVPTPTGCTWAEWTRSLEAAAGTSDLKDALRYWSDPARMRKYPIPRDLPGENTEATTEELTVSLAVTEWRRREIGELLLSSVAAAFRRWTKAPALNVDWISHGRFPLHSSLNVSRTTGYFSLRIPLVIEYGADRSAKNILPTVESAIGSVPHGGLSYGVLRFQSPDPNIRSSLSHMPQPELSFNYLGNLDLLQNESALIRPIDTPVGVVRDGTLKRAWLIQVFASIEAGKVRMLWRYNREIHHRTTIKMLANAALQEAELFLRDGVRTGKATTARPGGL